MVLVRVFAVTPGDSDGVDVLSTAVEHVSQMIINLPNT